MRKTQVSGRRSGDRIVLRAERGAQPRVASPMARALRTAAEKRVAASGKTRRSGVTMDYQMGFTSGPSH